MTEEMFQGLCARLENIERAVRNQSAKPLPEPAPAPQTAEIKGEWEPHEVTGADGKKVKEFRLKSAA